MTHLQKKDYNHLTTNFKETKQWQLHHFDKRAYLYILYDKAANDTVFKCETPTAVLTALTSVNTWY